MEWTCVIHFSGRELPLRLAAEPLGGDWLFTLQGGDAPHIGTAVMAVPRPSLTGSGAGSCTSSVLNLPGHLDELPCRAVAEKLCRALGRTVVCTGGIHIEDATPECLSAVTEAVGRLTESALRDLLSGNSLTS